MDTKKLNHTPEFEALCEDARSRVGEISCEVLQEMLGSGEGFYLIDVRDEDEFNTAHIKGAQFMSKGWIEAKIHNLVQKKDEKIVLYCGSGNRSVLAADNLQKMGYSHVLSMTGGIKGWVKSGKAVQE